MMLMCWFEDQIFSNIVKTWNLELEYVVLNFGLSLIDCDSSSQSIMYPRT